MMTEQVVNLQGNWMWEIKSYLRLCDSFWVVIVVTCKLGG